MVELKESSSKVKLRAVKGKVRNFLRTTLAGNPNPGGRCQSVK